MMIVCAMKIIAIVYVTGVYWTSVSNAQFLRSLIPRGLFGRQPTPPPLQNLPFATSNLEQLQIPFGHATPSGQQLLTHAAYSQLAAGNGHMFDFGNHWPQVALGHEHLHPLPAPHFDGWPPVVPRGPRCMRPCSCKYSTATVATVPLPCLPVY